MSGSAGPANQYEGYVDYADWDQIRGWAADRLKPNQVISIELWDGPTMLASVAASEHRPDVGQHLGDHGLHGFCIATPHSLKDGRQHSLQVRFPSSSLHLTNSPIAYTVAPHVWNHSNVQISQSYKATATKGARALPEWLQDDLLQAWLADTRGESFPLGPDVDAAAAQNQQFWIWFKEASESAAREGRVDLRPEDLRRGVCWFLRNNESLNLRHAATAYFDQVRAGVKQPASREDLAAAERELKDEVSKWLRANGIKVYEGQIPLIPTTALQTALASVRGKPDIYFAPDIPPDKLENALEASGAPSNDAIGVLVDCTFWGSAKDAVLFGSRGIYYNNYKPGLNGFLPYREFPHRTFNFTSTEGEVSLGDGERLSLAGSQVTAPVLIAMLEAAKREAISRTSKQSDTGGLRNIPGMAELKKVLLEDVVDALKNAEEYKKYKISIPNGILFYGPPGCGKTFVAQRLAKELDYNFFEISPGSIASPYIHESVLKISALFENAARNAPALMFVDEFEGLVPSRRDLGAEAQYKAEEVNEWLVQIGSCADRKILFIAATNEPWKIDEAVRRTGRIDKKIYVGPPDSMALKEMLAFHLDGRPIAATDVPDQFACMIEGLGYSASDVKVLVEEASKLAMRDRAPICCSHLQQAAAVRVSPSISVDTQELYLAFR